MTTGVLLAKDYVTLRLTGRRCIDPSDASGTNAYDQIAGVWSDEMLAAADIDGALLPEILPSASVAAGITPEVARLTGLREGTPTVGEPSSTRPTPWARPSWAAWPSASSTTGTWPAHSPRSTRSSSLTTPATCRRRRAMRASPTCARA